MLEFLGIDFILVPKLLLGNANFWPKLGLGTS